ncbi:phytoene/squalene synthase family protein [Sphingomonas montanisoli]|uniref:Phytoene/squalene synthase family protein n=1 Tax=Sphingomonas montanisoli TaxID=2606412 RepID=A0A5D9C628_9SPHN|nr:phytoene/squalene synthase family protein [Sphingomonas montanisoli]TZG27308.1 phytoene/squalene synthase family protein [Sphingomonas montanisoli]
MILAADRSALVAQAEATIVRGSQSFAMASRLFDRVTRERAWLLYAWCRTCDDVVDGQVLGHNMAVPADPLDRFETAFRQTMDALDGRPVDDPAFQGLALVVDETAMPRRFVSDHLAGFEADARGWRPQNADDLFRYCYQVAGVVGCMMAVVMGVSPHDDDTLDRACDLGIAFQLSNIARDIVEDADNGRCYIPEDWLAEAGLNEAELRIPSTAPQRATFAARLVAIADRHEASARVGAARLPFRCRWAILSAAGIYGGIGREVVRRGHRAWDERVRISGSKKAMLAMQALIASSLPSPRDMVRDGLWSRPR